MRRHLNTQGSSHVLCARLVCMPFSLVEVLSQTAMLISPTFHTLQLMQSLPFHISESRVKKVLLSLYWPL